MVGKLSASYFSTANRAKRSVETIARFEDSARRTRGVDARHGLAQLCLIMTALTTALAAKWLLKYR